MTSDKPLLCGLKLTTLIGLGVLSIAWQNEARSAELDCETMAFSLSPGDRYEFKLEIQSKMIRLEKGDDFCSEPAKDWFKRQLILPPPARDTMPLPSKAPSQSQDNAPLPGSADNTPLPGQQMRKGPLPDLGLETENGATPLPIQREYVKPKPMEEAPGAAEGQQPASPVSPDGTSKVHVSSDPGQEIKDPKAESGSKAESAPKAVRGPKSAEEGEEAVYGVAAPPPPKRDKSLIKRCDRELVGFWSPGQHVIEGRKFWLSGVFTIDLNSDGRVDDVGFKINAEGKIGNILNYFPATEGRLSGKTIPSLALDDDRDIHRLCPGNITFERPGVAPSSKKKRPASQVLGGAKKAVGDEKDAPAEEETQEETQEEESQVEEPPKKEINTVVFVVGAIALVLMLAGAIGLALAIRNITSSKKDEYEDDEDDEEEDE